MKRELKFNDEQLRRKKRKLLILFALMVALIPAGILYHVLTTPERIRRLAQSYIRQYTTENVSIGSANFSLWGGIRLYDVTIGQADDQNIIFDSEQTDQPSHQDGTSPVDVHGKPMFTCRQLHLQHKPLPALVGRLHITSAIAIQPTCTIIHDEVTGTTNLTSFLPALGNKKEGHSVRLPMIELRDARIEFYKSNQNQIRKIEELKLTIRGRPSKHHAGIYHVFWNSHDDEVTGGHSQIDLTTGQLRNIQGGLPSMSIEAVMLAVNAGYDGVGAWSHLLGLRGKVRARDYHLIITKAQNTSGWITLELSDASISVPIDRYEQTLPRNQRYIRLDGVNGSATVRADSIDAEFTGYFHSSPCQVSATIRSGAHQLTTLDDIDLLVKFKIQDLSLPRINDPHTPEQARFIYRWPQLARYYRIFDPRGRVNLEIEVEKNLGKNESVKIKHARLIAKDVAGTYRSFPYQARHISGVVEFTPTGIEIRNLTGQHNDGLFTVHGHIDSSAAGSAAELNISATNILIDESLYTVLPAPYRAIIDQFSPQGLIDVDAELSRSQATSEHPTTWSVHTAVSFEDLSACYEKFPYPLDHLSGNITFGQHQIRVSHVIGQHGDAVIQADGTIELYAGRIQNMGLTIHGKNVEIDGPLLSALPESLRKSVEVFHPAGRFDVLSTLEPSPDGLSAQRTYHFTLKDVELSHQQLPLPFSEINGNLSMFPDRFIVHRLTGRYHQGLVTAGGTIARAKSRFSTAITFQGVNIKVDDELLDTLPDQWRVPFAQWSINGSADTVVEITTNTTNSGRPLHINTTVHLKDAIVSHQDPNFEFHDVQATITLDDKTLCATDIQAQFQNASFTGNCEIHTSDPYCKGSASFSVTGLLLDSSFRSAIPKRLYAMWDRMTAGGEIDIHIEDMDFSCASPDRPNTCNVKGRVDLHNVSLGSSGIYQKINGTVSVQGALIDPQQGTMLGGFLKLDQTTLFNHPLDQIEGAWSLIHTKDGRGQFTLENIQGNLYDGSLAASLEILFDPTAATYDLSSTLQNMDIRPYIQASRRAPVYSAKPPEIRGRANAHLFMAGQIGEPNSRRGVGRIEIKKGYLYRLPILLSILHVLNLTIPEQDAFEEATTTFYIAGRRVQLEDILLRSHSLTLVGDGTITLPGQGVDLNLVYVSDNRITRLPVVSDILYGASSRMMPLHVTGSLHGPKVHAMPFRQLTKELKQLFKKKKPKKK